MNKKTDKITVEQIEVNVYKAENQEFISLTDIASFKNPVAPKDVVKIG